MTDEPTEQPGTRAFPGIGWISTAKLFKREKFGIDLDEEKDRYLFIADSPNDAPMLAYFPPPVGVANIRDMAATVPHLLAHVTEECNGEGFAEVIRMLLAGR